MLAGKGAADAKEQKSPGNSGGAVCARLGRIRPIICPWGPPPTSVQLSQLDPIESLGQRLERELSEGFRRAARELRVELPTGTPIPGMSIGILPDGSVVAAVPAGGLGEPSSALRSRTTLGLLYLSTPKDGLPSGFYRMELLPGPRGMVMLTGTVREAGPATFAASTEQAPGGATFSPTTSLQWNPIASGGEVCVSVTVGKISVVVCIRW